MAWLKPSLELAKARDLHALVKEAEEERKQALDRLLAKLREKPKSNGHHVEDDNDSPIA